MKKLYYALMGIMIFSLLLNRRQSKNHPTVIPLAIPLAAKTSP